METDTKGLEKRYRIRGELGRKGVNLVWEGYDEARSRDVLIKRVDTCRENKHRYTPDDLVKDAIALASLRHPNFIAVYDYGKDREGTFVVTEPVQGVILESALEKRVFLLDDFAELVKQTLESLIAAHDAGLTGVHLDPWNIMLVRRREGGFQVKVLGMGRMAANALPIGGDTLRDRGRRVAALPPKGIPQRCRAEFLSLGRLYYQALTGRRPFGEAESVEVLGCSALEKMPSCREFRPDVPEAMCHWITWLIRRADLDSEITARGALERFLFVAEACNAPPPESPVAQTVDAMPIPRREEAAVRESEGQAAATPAQHPVASVGRGNTAVIPSEVMNLIQKCEVQRGVGERRENAPGSPAAIPRAITPDVLRPSGSELEGVVLEAPELPPVRDPEDRAVARKRKGSGNVKRRSHRSELIRQREQRSLLHDIGPASVDLLMRWRVPALIVAALLCTSFIVLAGHLWKRTAPGKGDATSTPFVVSTPLPGDPLPKEREDRLMTGITLGEPPSGVSATFHAAALGRSLPETLAGILAEAKHAEGAGDDLTAFRHYLAAVEKFPGEDGSIEDLTRYVDSLSNRPGNVIDFLEESLRQSAEEGVGPAMRILGERSSALGRWEEAVTWLGKASAKKDVRATTLLGLLLSEGKGAPRDMEAAVECFEWSAQHGDSHAAYLAGECIVLGKGVAKNPEKGLDYLRESAGRGDVRALDLIGVCHARGIGGRVDFEEAYACFKEAAERGCAGALANLGVLHMNGQGVAKDPVSAVKFFREGLENGNARCMYLYARCLDEGLGIAKNRSHAEEWYRKAVMHGSSEARKWIAEHDPRFAG